METQTPYLRSEGDMDLDRIRNQYEHWAYLVDTDENMTEEDKRQAQIELAEGFQKEERNIVSGDLKSTLILISAGLADYVAP